MKIMAINAGSSSLKFSLFEMPKRELVASGYFERVGLEGSFYTIKYNGEKICEEIEIPNHEKSVEVMLDRLVTLNIIKSLDEIDGVGHRIVHGSDKYKGSVILTDKVLEDIKSFSDLAPLHNPANILGVEAMKKALPNITMVGVFDTAFHSTMDMAHYLYPVPYDWYLKYGVRKYGFHGTSHQYVTKKISEVLGRDDLKLIICHLGSGASISAVKDNKCLDTSMGFTPLAGVMMGTRSGDIDPSIIQYVMEKEGLNIIEAIDELNKNSGLLGISGVSSDCRDIEKSISEGNERAILAMNMMVQTVVNYIAKYYVELGGVDCLCFTAGIGENAYKIRKRIIDRLTCLGFTIDDDKNNTCDGLMEISKDGENIKVYVVPTNEELMIALETTRLITS